MSRELWRERVRVMIEDIDRVGEFVREHTRESFATDDRAVFATCYAFVRLGEGVAAVPPDVVGAHPEIEWGDIRHFRNFMVHVYMSVNPARLYDTATDDLPGLRAKLVALLETEERTS